MFILVSYQDKETKVIDNFANFLIGENEELKWKEIPLYIFNEKYVTMYDSSVFYTNGKNVFEPVNLEDIVDIKITKVENNIFSSLCRRNYTDKEIKKYSKKLRKFIRKHQDDCTFPEMLNKIEDWLRFSIPETFNEEAEYDNRVPFTNGFNKNLAVHMFVSVTIKNKTYPKKVEPLDTNYGPNFNS